MKMRNLNACNPLALALSKIKILKTPWVYGIEQYYHLLHSKYFDLRKLMKDLKNTPEYAHFKGKEAIEHVIDAQVQGKISAAEIHGTEIPGHIPAGTDAAKETAILLSLLWISLLFFPISNFSWFLYLAILGFGWTVWKTGRSAWLGWSRLEKLHRILEQERWEIEHHRQQERDELRVLYQAKGFEGKLLEDVLDVLMADNERLLRVMVEEELGLSLQSHEHPLKQCLGAAAGCIISTLLCLAGLYAFPSYGLIIASLFTLCLATFISSHYENNEPVPSMIWNLGIALISLGAIYFIMEYFTQSL